MLTKSIPYPAAVLLLVIAVVVFLAACGEGQATPTPTREPLAAQDSLETGDGATEAASEAVMEKDADAMMDKDADAMSESFPAKITASHFVDSDPSYGDTVSQVPDEIVLNFNFNLHSDSAITILRDGEPVSLGQVQISPDQLSLRVPVLETSADGIYRVDYKACWPDRSCHEGRIAFIVKESSLTPKQRHLSDQSQPAGLR